MRRFFREPLVHFVMLGGLAFGVHEAWQRWRGERDVIVVSRATREHLERELSAGLGRAPAEAERAQALERWKLDEAAYRVAELSGLLARDELVRARLVARARDVFRGLEQVRAPSDAELEAFARDHRARYERPEQFELEQAFAARAGGAERARAAGFVAAAEAGAPLGGQGDEFPAGNRVEGAFEDLARVFGFGFATELAKASPGRVMVLEGTRGMHAVRLLRRVPPSLPPASELRPRLLLDYFREQEAELGERALRRIRDGYRFVEES